MLWLDKAQRFLFFTGKGGVGKTSISAASAIALADAGKRVLLVSTDAASNLDEMLGISLQNVPVPVPGVPGLACGCHGPCRCAGYVGLAVCCLGLWGIHPYATNE